jgi:hypothetical protein
MPEPALQPRLARIWEPLAGCKSFLRVRFPPLSCSVEVNHPAAANDRDAISYGRRLLFE